MVRVTVLTATGCFVASSGVRGDVVEGGFTWSLCNAVCYYQAPLSSAKVRASGQLLCYVLSVVGHQFGVKCTYLVIVALATFPSLV